MPDFDLSVIQGAFLIDMETANATDTQFVPCIDFWQTTVTLGPPRGNRD
jgi:hypothetical protein